MGTVLFSSPIKGVYDPKAFFPHAASLRQAFAHCARSLAAASRRSRGRISVPVWLIILSDQLPVSGLVGRYPTNYLIGQRPLLKRPKPFITSHHEAISCGISSDFSKLSPTSGQVTFALLSRSPLASNRNQKPVRLACIRHAASVHPELGSNPPMLTSTIQLLKCSIQPI